MATTAVAFPILPGKVDDVRRFAAEIMGPRREELSKSFRGFGITREAWYLQPMPQGALLVAYIEAEDPLRMFHQWAASQDPFDVWYKQQAGACAGIDFSRPVPGLPDQVMNWP